MKRAPMLLLAGAGFASGVYTVIYLYRWEWNRALIAGLFFLASEIGMATLLVLGHLRRIGARLDRIDGRARLGHDGPDPVVLDRLRESAPPAHDHFAWLRDTTSFNVFLPVLLGVGVVASGLATVVEALARGSAAPTLERRLAMRLAPLSLPAGGLLGAPVAAPAAPRRSGLAVFGLGVLAVLAAGGVAAGLDVLADRIQTRPDVTSPDAVTVVDLELRGELATASPERVMAHLWAVCTGPDVFTFRRLPEPSVRYGPAGAVHLAVPVDIGRHGLERLTGCLNDTTLTRVQASVVDAEIR